MPKRRTAIRLGVLLLLGATVNVAVAWGCSNWSTVGFSKSEPLFGQQSEFEEYAREQGISLQASSGMWAWSQATMMGVTWHQAHRWADADSEVPIAFLQLHKAGWPLRSVKCTGSTKWPPKVVNGLSEVEWDAGFRCPSFLEPNVTGGNLIAPSLPYGPIWPGFAINTIFYAAVLWMLFAFPFALRRHRRIKRGLCFACAYPIGTSEVCTECGKSVTPRVV